MSYFLRGYHSLNFSYVGILLCVIGICCGQILFKLVALDIASEQELAWSMIFNYKLVAGITTYGVATVLWILLLRTVSLSRAYPIMGLSFVIVPVLSKLFFGESLDIRNYIGSALILSGVIVSTAR